MFVAAAVYRSRQNSYGGTASRQSQILSHLREKLGSRQGLVLVGNSKVMLKTYRGGVPRLRPSTDWRNGSASDSSPEGYAFKSRIGH